MESMYFSTQPDPSADSKRTILRELIDRDALAADLRLSLFVSAARSFKYDSCLQPFPPDFINGNKEKNIDELNRVLGGFQPLQELDIEDLASKHLDLLHWILCQKSNPGLRTVPKKDFDSILAKAPCIAAVQRPQQIFEVVYREDSNLERRFREKRDQFARQYAYHGSKLFNFYSILNYGLQQHLNRTALFGEGIYLSAELHVSQMFAPTGAGWAKSALGSHLACTALCEYIDNPDYVKCHTENSITSDIPEKYILVKNNDLVQVRYLLVYGSNRRQVAPSEPELYLCTPVKVDYTKSYYIVGFEPNATMATAHHMLLYGCGAPGSESAVWNCGEMAKSDDIKEETGSPCGAGSSSQIIYAWARDAPKLELQDGVGFKVGLDSPIKYIVLQVHYANIDKFKDGTTSDDSGIFLHYTLKQMNKRAGVLLLGTGGSIPPNQVEHMETVCNISENKTIHPFAYRTHTHSLGRVVSGYQIKVDEQGQNHWTRLGKRDPLTPQMFYPVESTAPIRKGDRLAARCTMESNRSTVTNIGATNNDEMCNFYLMYYVEDDEPLQMKYCFSSGPPYFYWHNKDTELNNIPDYDASHL